MSGRLRLQLLPLLLLALAGCNGDDDDGPTPADPPDPAPPVLQRGELIGVPALAGSYSPGELLALAAPNEIVQILADALLTPQCRINVYHFEYRTVDPAGNLTPASAAMMVPNDSPAACLGARPMLLYAHGTSPDRAFDISDLNEAQNGEGLLLAAVFAAQGYIVVAPNYVGYDTSTLPYHPYLNGDQQSKDMLDALAAARKALPTAGAPSTLDDGRLFVTGYSQGGYVAMATHRALEQSGLAVTASAPMSGPYALAAFGDAMFQGQVTGGAPVNLTLMLNSYQKAYGDIYATPGEAFEAQYATGIETLLPGTTPVGELKAQGRLPDTALFDSTPPEPAYAAMTPATTPANLAPVFAIGFGTEHLLTNAFRLAYLRDAQANPDGGFPAFSTGLPPADPVNPFRRALKLNDQRAWTPTRPMLLCAGNSDPAVLYLNTSLMQAYWSTATNVSVLDIDSATVSGEPYESRKRQFAVAKDLVRLTEGDIGVLEKYHAGLVAPFCLGAVKSFFDGF